MELKQNGAYNYQIRCFSFLLRVKPRERLVVQGLSQQVAHVVQKHQTRELETHALGEDQPGRNKLG